ncbi:MAG TPA: hypothetical protein VEH52_07305 [Gaiellaceae bacterium]|nr:hypothetical protein [Gaiellaceae bacterium]
MSTATLIPTPHLRVEDLPAPGSEWSEYASFASTFDPEQRYRSVDVASEVANWAFSRWQKNGRLPESVDEIRACLYFEQRRWRFIGHEPNPEGMRWVQALVAEMRRHIR